MVAKTLLDLVKKLKVTDYNGLEDIGDKISFQISVLIFMICGVIVTSKTYIMKPLSCYTAIHPTGSNFDGYLRNFCWVTGTVPDLPGNEIKASKDLDGLKKINYYQWVPFVLALQCIMFYLPRLLWQTASYNKMGINLELLFADAKKAMNDNTETRKKTANKIANSLGRVFHYHQDTKYGAWASFRRKIFRFASIFVMSKKMGTWLTSWYFLIKCMFLANAIGQLFILHRFLGFEGYNIFQTSRSLISTALKGMDWKTSGIFPSRSYCQIDNIKLLGSDNNYVSQCVLSMNMVNEKVYIFLWIWLHIVVVTTGFTMLLWLKKLVICVNRREFIKKYLKNQDLYRKSKRDQFDNFAHDFLRHDGTFILNMMSINCGDLMTTAVICELWEIYQSKYASSDTSSEKDPNLLNLYPNVSSDFSEKLAMKNSHFI